jgi:acetoin utilization protein AcuB
MTEPAIVCGPETTRSEALDRMIRLGIRRMPVVNKGALVGIITKSDLQSVRPGHLVADLMARDPVTVVANETLERAALTMLSRKVSGLPVVEGERILGMITETDVFRAMVELLGMSEKGARLVLTLHSPAKLLEEIGRRAGNMQLRSVVTYHDPHTREWKAMVRLRGRLPAPAQT